MAAKVGILEIGQDETCEPMTFVRKCVAEMMLRRLEVEPIRKNLVRRLIIKAANVIAAKFIPGYVPITILPIRDWRECLLLYYPVRDQTS